LASSHVVTGDRRFLSFGEHAGVAIVTPRASLDLLGAWQRDERQRFGGSR